MDNSAKKYGTIVVILLIITTGLFYLEYQNERNPDSPSLFTSALKTFVTPPSITAEILSKTSLQDKAIASQARSNNFFDPYLKLPNKITAARYNISDTNILVYEIQSQNAGKIIKELTSQEGTDFQFNIINQNTFYLNQVPSENKTHNFLAIAINNVLYGFQYQAHEHQKILEIIDALNNNG